MKDFLATTPGRLLILGVALVLVCLPRFNRQDLGLTLTPGQQPAADVLGDADEYMALVAYFRDGEVGPALRPPFAQRILAPWLASHLPFEPMTALNVINLASLLAALVFLDLTMGELGATPTGRRLGGALFVFAFPAFYYGTIGFIDPVLIGWLAAALYFLVRGNHLALLVSLMLGGLTRETMLIFVPVLLVHALQVGRENRRELVWAVAGVAAVVFGIQAAHLLSPVDTAGVVAGASFERLVANATRSRTWLSFALSVGLPGAIAAWGLLSGLPARPRLPRSMWPLVAGMGTGLALFGVAMLTAYADGRFAWTTTVFSVPLAVWALGHNPHAPNP